MIQELRECELRLAPERASSFGRILKSTSVIGGAQGINLLLGLVRVKMAAVLIGPVGVGLLGTFQVLQDLVTTLAGLGLQSSAVRDIAAASGRDDQESISRAVVTLRRLCWVTGLMGACVLAATARLLSEWTFGSATYSADIAVLGLAILFINLQGGQMALLQGTRRIGAIARVNVIGAIGGTVLSGSLYVWLGLRGIVPTLVLLAAVQFAASWYFARKVPIVRVDMTWLESLHAGRGMVRLGLTFMWSALTVSLVAYLTRALIAHQISLEAVGIFSAAFVLAGMFINFVLAAMGADYYPRLTALASDHTSVNRLVNEQTEIGLLLAVPGLLATLCSAPWIVEVLYAKEFSPAVSLLQWLVLGCMGRVLSWPLSFTMLALGRGSWFFASETLGSLLHLLFVALGLLLLGIEGAAIAFFVLYLPYTIGVYLIVRHLTGFEWSPEVLGLMVPLSILVTTAFVATRALPIFSATIVGALASALSLLWCVKGLHARIGHDYTGPLSSILRQVRSS